MNAQETSIRNSALGWVKKSIDDNLLEVESDLKRYIESNEPGLLEGIKQRLGVTQGVLVMVEQYGAAMLTEEMIALVDFIVTDKESKPEQSLEVLLRAVLQLPDYLEHIQSGHRDIPIAILPLLNDVRAVRNQDLFSEKLLFLPDLSMHQDDAEVEGVDDISNQASRLLVKKLRPVYQLALVNIIRDKSVEESLKRLEKICETLEERSVSEQIARIWWIVGALIESVSRQQLELGVSIKNLLGKVDALFRVILIIGERGLMKRQPIELIKNFLYYIAQPECDGPKAQAIKTAYRLEQFLPTESERSEVLNNIAGPNQALLKTVAEAMKAEIEAIKSTLEIYVNGDLTKVEALKDLPQEMHVISDTLAMIGLGSQRQLIESQMEMVKQILEGGQGADEEQLLSMAAELLLVEQALEQMSKRQPNRVEQPRSESDVSRDYELDSVLSSVVTAALDNIQKTKNAILEFIKDPERSDNIDLCINLMLESRGALQLLEQHRAVSVVDGLLTYLRGYEVSEFMQSAQLDALSQIVVSLEYYLEALGEHRGDASSILDLADTQLKGLLANFKAAAETGADSTGADGEAVVPILESVEVTDESKRPAAESQPADEPGAEIDAPMVDEIVDEEPEQASVAESQEPEVEEIDEVFDETQVLSLAQEGDGLYDDTQVIGSVSELKQSRPDPRDSVVRHAEVVTTEQADRTARANRPAAGEKNGRASKAAEQSTRSPTQAIEIRSVNDDAEVLKSGSDAEILEIYLEEAEEEASNIVRLQKDWLLHPEDENALRNIRRAFHTIKGSGRLVGALKIGEFAWDYEQLLNRIIDKTVPPERQVINAVGKAGQALTELVHELKTFEEPTADIPYLRGLARALAEFKTEELLIDHTQTMSIIESPYDHITDDDDDDDKTEVLHAGFGATTQMIDAEVGETGPQSWVDADATASRNEGVITTRDESQETQQIAEVESDISKYDDTVLTEAPPVPTMDDRRRVEAEVRTKIAAVARARAEVSYQRAADYSRVSEAAANDDASAVDEDAFEEREAASRPAIEIESMGEDFVGEGVVFGDSNDLAEQVSLAASMTPEMQPPESEEIEIESLPPLSDIVETDQLADDQPVNNLGTLQSVADADEAVPQKIFEPSTLEGEAEAFDEDVKADEIELTELADDAEVAGLGGMQTLGDEFQAGVFGEEAAEIEITGFTEEPEVAESELQALEELLEARVFDEEAEAEAIEIMAFTEEDSAEEIEMASVAGEFEIEDIEMETVADEPEIEEIEMGAVADESEFEEIEMGAVADESEFEEIEMGAVADESKLEELDMQAILEQAEVQEIEFESLDETAAQDSVDTPSAADERHEPSAFAAPSDREDPPDPFVETTRGAMPGAAAEGSEPRVQGQPEPTGLSFDPELLTIYQQEVEQHLAIVSTALDEAEKTRELIPSEGLYRALHTINGASRTADITTIGQLAALLEKPLKTAVAQSLALDHEVVALYREGQHALNAMTAELVATRLMPDIPRDLQISLQALADDFEEYTVDLSDDESGQSGDFIDTLTMMNDSVDSEQDMELLAIFVDEANELLEMSDNTLHQWSQQQLDEPGAQDYSAVMELQRYLHTLKGGARMAELTGISDLSHEMESLFIAVIDGRVEKSDNLLEMLKDSFDLLHLQVNQAQQAEGLSAPEEMVEALKQLRRDEDQQNHAESLDELAEFDLDSEDIDIVSENLPGEPLSSVGRTAQDVIKVRADLLDNLVSSAGEVSIYRARMEQQVAGLGSHLGELGQTIARLKTQLRSLEAETDAQIHFSHRNESSRTGEFDPLEMDRYTSIQELSRSLGESVNDLSSLQHMLGDQVKDSETLLLQQSRVSADLQDGLIKSRMVKFSGLLSRLRRLVRQSSQELGKKAELVVSGEQNEVDNKVLDRMVAPLEHIIRNALSHGIETPAERVKKGKQEVGHIAIDITRGGSDVVIRVSDDGAGVDIEKVRGRAVQLGLLEKGQVASETDLVQYILEPGFSTAEHVTQLSGRGVGMDVVDIEVKQLGGTLQIETTPQGTTFVARLPFTLAINQAILVRCGEETFAIPLPNIEGITRLDAQQMHAYYREAAPQLEYAGQSFALHNLAKLVGSESLFRAGVETEKQAIILGRAGDLRVALHVDEIIGNREIVVKALGKQLSQVKSLAGASILADGSVVLILDIGGLIRHNVGNTVKVVYTTRDVTPTKLRDTVMVVDDSITMRRVATKLLERHNYEVITAKDGVDALAQLQDVRPDVVLLDVEMPRMDGFELATHMQNEGAFSTIPIIMITSRTGEKHRHRALEIGVTNYMGKPYQEEELIQNIQSALAGG